ncbi:MAG: dTDP-4-dehydrorhamnose 3,5-epimerase [Chitinophagaceae bacterium]|nr:dTDP-4-dehydrorhamnose 3,5-epimerase [Chitinophagaceae bacterium]
MIFNAAKLPGAYTIEAEPFRDSRGFFTRTFCRNEFSAHGLETNFVQSNHSGNLGKGIIRGMHFQYPPHSEVKLVKCIRGAIFDVIVDVRSGSPTFLQWFGAELTDDNKRMMYIPRGFAHGFQSLSEYSELTYMVSAFYNKESEGGISYLDPSVNIEWPLPIGIVSDKDKAVPFVDDTFMGVKL